MMLCSNYSCAAHKNNFSHPSEVELGLVAFTSCGVELGKAETASTSRSRPQNVLRSLRRFGPVVRF